MALTEFGKAVRKARIDIGETLLSMASAIGTTASFLSGMETGRKKIADDWVAKIDDFLTARGKPINDLQELANVANKSVPIDGLPLQQQMLIAGFAKSPFTPEELQAVAHLLQQINHQKE